MLIGSAGTRGLTLADALEGMQVYQHVDQGIVIGDGCAVAQLGTLDTQNHGLTIESLTGGALLVDVLVDGAVTVELIPDASADAGGKSGRTAAFGPVLVTNRAGAGRDFREAQRADVAATFVFEAGGATGKGVLFSSAPRPALPSRRRGLLSSAVLLL